MLIKKYKTLTIEQCTKGERPLFYAITGSGSGYRLGCFVYSTMHEGYRFTPESHTIFSKTDWLAITDFFANEIPNFK